LADKKLVSITVNGNASVQYDPQGSSAIKASLQVANLVVSDPKRQLPATPLEARLEIDTAVKKAIGGHPPASNHAHPHQNAGKIRSVAGTGGLFAVERDPREPQAHRRFA